jgi:hypothetical protein
MRLLQIYLIKLHRDNRQNWLCAPSDVCSTCGETEPATQANQGGPRVLNNQKRRRKGFEANTNAPSDTEWQARIKKKHVREVVIQIDWGGRVPGADRGRTQGVAGGKRWPSARTIFRGGDKEAALTGLELAQIKVNCYPHATHEQTSQEFFALGRLAGDYFSFVQK